MKTITRKPGGVPMNPAPLTWTPAFAWRRSAGFLLAMTLAGLLGSSPDAMAFENTAWQCTTRYNILAFVEEKAGGGATGGPARVQRWKATFENVPLVATDSGWSLGAGGDFGVLGGLMAIINPRLFVPVAGRSEFDAWIHDTVLERSAGAFDIDVIDGILIGQFKTNRAMTRTRGRLVSSFAGELPADLLFGNVDLRLKCVPA